jgi:Leucine-rich repeat (LRR) protein
LAVLVISVAMGIYVNRVRQQQASIAAIKRLGGWAYYDYEVKENGQYDPQGESWVPAWIRKRLPDDYFHPVVQVNMVYNDDRGNRLDNAQMTDEVLFHLDGLPRLEMLLLHGRQASDDGLAHVGRLTNLRKLYIWNSTSVTDAGVAHLAGCRNLESLHLSESQLGDEGLRVLSELPRLKGLSLQGNRCTDAGLAHVGQMPQLTSLWIGCMDEERSKITGSGLTHLGKLTQLEELDLQNTGVGDEELAPLAALKGLKSLLLSGTAVKDLSRLQAALPNCKIDAPLPDSEP